MMTLDNIFDRMRRCLLSSDRINRIYVMRIVGCWRHANLARRSSGNSAMNLDSAVELTVSLRMK